MAMNAPIRVTKVQMGRLMTLEVAFEPMAGGMAEEMMQNISEITGLSFSRPPGNLGAYKELHIARLNTSPEEYDRLFLLAYEIAEQYGETAETRQNLGAPEPGDEPMPIDRRGLALRMKSIRERELGGQPG